MLTVSVKYGLHATQVDFNNDFVQAPLKEPMFMSLLPGFDQQTGQCLCLTKSLYGHKFAAKLFYELLRDTLTDQLGFYISPIYHCLFVQHHCIIINWVDNQLLLTKDPAVALEIVEVIRNVGLILDIKSDSGSIATTLEFRSKKKMMGHCFSLNQVSSIVFLRQWISRTQIQRTHQLQKPSEPTNSRLHSTGRTIVGPSSV
jgi:hypothetical protein